MAKKELLFSVTKKDFDINYFSGTGAGGQYRNKHQNCVRLLHPESGARSTGQSNRERQANLKEAFQTLIKSTRFKLWLNQRTQQALTGKSIEDVVQASMDADNLKVECRGDKGKWELYDNDGCDNKRECTA